jgi:hypothetical protein
VVQEKVPKRVTATSPLKIASPRALTRLTLGVSADASGALAKPYAERGIRKADPFKTLDEAVSKIAKPYASK